MSVSADKATSGVPALEGVLCVEAGLAGSKIGALKWKTSSAAPPTVRNNHQSLPAHFQRHSLLLPSCPAFFCRATDRLAFAPSEPLTTPARFCTLAHFAWRLYLSTSLAPFSSVGPSPRCPLPFTFCYPRGQSRQKIAANILSPQAQCSVRADRKSDSPR